MTLRASVLAAVSKACASSPAGADREDVAVAAWELASAKFAMSRYPLLDTHRVYSKLSELVGNGLVERAGRRLYRLTSAGEAVLSGGRRRPE